MIDARLLALLCCPCGGALRQIGGILSCGECGGHYPVIGGIPRFSPRAEAGQAQVAEAFGYKWRRAAGFGMSGETEAVMQDWLLDLRGWQNETEYADFLSPFRTILDAGSGNGRDLAQIARLLPDALTVGIEISAAIDVAAENVKHLPNVVLVQGDICRPPLKPGSFDYVTSNGVLHHTPNTKEAMRSVLSLLAPGGQLAFTLYRKKAPIREFTDDYVRREIRNMTPAEAWREMESVTLLGKALSDFRAEIEIPDVKVLGMQGGRHNLQRFLYYTVLKCYWRNSWSFEDNVHVNYDWYYPEYAWRHTAAEVRRWGEELNAEEIFSKQIPAQLSFRMRRPVSNEPADGAAARSDEPGITLDAPSWNDSATLFDRINQAETVRFNAAFQSIDEGSHEMGMRGDRVTLTGFLPSDKATLFRWINDPEILRFNAAYRPVNWAQHCAWWDSLNSTETTRSFAIRTLDDDRIIGTAQLTGIHQVHRRAEVSIRIGEQVDRQRGAGTEALRMLARYAFDHLNLHRIFIHVWMDNLRAIRAYEKAGFQREGVMARHVFIGGEWKDVVIMAALRPGRD